MNSTPEKIEKTTSRALRFRAVLVGVLFGVLICALTPFNNAYRDATLLGGGHFPLAPFFILMWMTVFAALLNRIFRRSFLTGMELLFIWVLMVLVSGIAYTGLMRTFFINITAPFRYATVGNQWETVLHPLLPQSWYPSDTGAVSSLYNGLDGGWRMGWVEVLGQVPWSAWATPLLVWGGFVLLCYFVMLCIINVFSGQWIENERMNMPLLRVPQLLEQTIDEGGLGKLLGNRFLLFGLMIPVCLHLLNGLSFYFPSVPSLSTLVLAGPYFPKYGLFSGFIKLKIYIYPAFIGFAFLASRQISLSFWAFFLLGGFLTGLLAVLGYHIPASALGTTFGPTLARPEETQMIGAYGVFFLFIMWLARFHLRDVALIAIGKKKPEQTAPAAFSLRVSAWGAVLGVVALCWWCTHFGLPFLASALFVGAGFMVMIVATRVICQGGVAYFTLTAAPIDGLLALFGSRFFTSTGLLVAAVVQKVLFVDLRESLMPSLLHAEAATAREQNRRLVLLGIVGVLVLGLLVSFGAWLALCYKFGLRELSMDWATNTTIGVYENVQNLVQAPQDPGRWVLVFALIGAGVMAALVICYHRFYWWPIHPIGYLMAYSSAMRILWFSFFIGWLANALCMRYGGIALFKRMRLFFIGLVMGDFLMGGAFALAGLFTDASYQVLPS